MTDRSKEEKLLGTLLGETKEEQDALRDFQKIAKDVRKEKTKEMVQAVAKELPSLNPFPSPFNLVRYLLAAWLVAVKLGTVPGFETNPLQNVDWLLVLFPAYFIEVLIVVGLLVIGIVGLIGFVGYMLFNFLRLAKHRHDFAQKMKKT